MSFRDCPSRSGSRKRPEWAPEGHRIPLCGTILPVQSAKHVSQRAFKSVQDQLEPAQGDALLRVLEPMDSGRRQTHLLAELGERHLAALFPDEPGQLLVEAGWHPATMNKRLFPIRNNSLGYFASWKPKLAGHKDHGRSLRLPTMRLTSFGVDRAVRRNRRLSGLQNAFGYAHCSRSFATILVG